MCLRSSLSVSRKRTATQQQQQQSQQQSQSPLPPSPSHDGHMNTAKSVSFGESTTVTYQPKRTSRSLYANHKNNRQSSSNSNNDKSSSWKADHYMNNRAMYIRYGLLVSVICLWTMLGSIASSYGSTKRTQSILEDTPPLSTDHTMPAIRRRLQSGQIEIIDGNQVAQQQEEEQQQEPELPVDIVTHMVPSLEDAVVEMTPATSVTETVTAVVPEEIVTPQMSQVTEPVVSAADVTDVVVPVVVEATSDHITETKEIVDPQKVVVVKEEDTPAEVVVAPVAVEEAVSSNAVVVEDHVESDNVVVVAELTPASPIKTEEDDREKDVIKVDADQAQVNVAEETVHTVEESSSIGTTNGMVESLAALGDNTNPEDVVADMAQIVQDVDPEDFIEAMAEVAQEATAAGVVLDANPQPEVTTEEEQVAVAANPSVVVTETTPVVQTSRRLVASSMVDIPSQFANDYEIFGYDQHWERSSFPRWDLFPETDDDTISLQQMKDSYKISIMDSTIHFIQEQIAFLSKFDYSVKERDQKSYYDLLWNVGWSNNVHTSDHSDVTTPNYWQPEALYVVDGDKGVVMTSALTKEISNTDGFAITYKYSPTERIMSVGLNMLLNKDDNDELHETIMSRWPRLHEIIVEKHSSFPFLAHYSDYVGCNYHNWNGGKESLPLFTVAGNVNCNHTFPFPTYGLSFDARYSPPDWYRDQKKWSDHYGPWIDKKSQVVWRGSLTGKMPKEIEKRAPRWHLLKKVHDDTQLSKEQQQLFDVKLTYITEYAQYEWIQAEELGGTNQSNAMKMDDFQQYKAILDVDGHSWSSRFAQLMCYSSVILKVEPQYVDYYYYPVNRDDDPYTPQPWKHFIPVKFDMSDLEEKAAFAVDASNEPVIRQIIQNANDWCANKLTIQSLGMDALDIWEKYVTILDQSTELKNIITSERLETGEFAVARHLTAYEPESWLTQWNQMKYDIYNGILQMVPANPAW